MVSFIDGARRTAGALVAAAALLTACDGPADADERFSVALLLPGDEQDEGWNQSAWEGLQAIEADLGARTLNVRADAAQEIQRALERAAQEGFDLVIGHGAEYNAPAAVVAAAYPGTQFLTTGGTDVASNLGSVQFALEEPAYQLGVLAGHLTKSGTVSAISGEPFEPVERVVDGFRRGLLSVRPDARLLVDYVGSWVDAVRAKEMALAHAAQGADLFFQNADSAGVGIFEACRQHGAFAFGCNRDQSAAAPDIILASAVADIPQTFLELAREVSNGSPVGGVRRFDLADGEVRVVFNPALDGPISDDVRAAVAAAGQRLANGEIDLGS